MSKNDVTGDVLKTKLGTKEELEAYSSGYDLIFGKKKEKKDEVMQKVILEDFNKNM